MNDLNLIEVGKRIKRAVNYLIYLEDMDDRKEFSNKFGYAYTNLSKVFKGNPKYVNLKFISRVCETYPNVFIENWFITGEGQMLKEASSSPPNSDAASIYKELYEKKEAELAVSQKRIEELIEHNARLEQELSVFITKKTNVPEAESVSDAVEILGPTGTGDL